MELLHELKVNHRRTPAPGRISSPPCAASC
jgi:hypothetical protein